jgi:hypothetical protein
MEPEAAPPPLGPQEAVEHLGIAQPETPAPGKPPKARGRQDASMGCILEQVSLEHKHHALPKTYLPGRQAVLTPLVKDELKQWEQSGLGIGEMLKLLKQKHHSVWVNVTGQDIVNALGRPPAVDDAQDTLKDLLAKKALDPRWEVRHVTVDGVLQALIWLSPKQKELAMLYGLVALLHDLTYNVSMYDIRLGLFAGVSNHGRTLLFGQHICVGEAMMDYMWAYATFQEWTQLNPRVVWTDAAAAVTIPILTVWPNALHLHCMWHVLKRLRDNLPVKIPRLEGQKKQGTEDTPVSVCLFIKHFFQVQRQVDTSIATLMWGTMLELWQPLAPLAVAYVKEWFKDLTKWVVAWHAHIFVAGIQSTQRGESLNKMAKAEKLHKKTRLLKLLQALTNLAENIDKRALLLDIKSTVPMRQAASSAAASFGASWSAIQTHLTPWACDMICRQIYHFGAYNSETFTPSAEPLGEFSPVFDFGTPPGATAMVASRLDSDDAYMEYTDLPRFASLWTILEHVGGPNACHVHRVWRSSEGIVYTSHYLVLYAKDEATGLYTKFWCTCGYSVRFGAPCRHFWKVLKQTEGHQIVFDLDTHTHAHWLLNPRKVGPLNPNAEEEPLSTLDMHAYDTQLVLAVAPMPEEAPVAGPLVPTTNDLRRAALAWVNAAKSDPAAYMLGMSRLMDSLKAQAEFTGPDPRAGPIRNMLTVANPPKRSRPLQNPDVSAAKLASGGGKKSRKARKVVVASPALAPILQGNHQTALGLARAGLRQEVDRHGEQVQAQQQARHQQAALQTRQADDMTPQVQQASQQQPTQSIQYEQARGLGQFQERLADFESNVGAFQVKSPKLTRAELWDLYHYGVPW